MSQNDLYWKAMAEAQIKRDFDQFLREEGMERNPDSAQLFAMRRISGGHRDVSERDLILLLVGELPFAYD